jgi:hypothetical protein
MFGTYYSRTDILFAYAWYAMLWGPTAYGQRLHRMRVRLGVCARLETEDQAVKEVYGRIVRREHASYVGFSRLQKRAKGRLALSWPGTNNMPRGVRAWLQSEGIDQAVRSYVHGGL